MPTAAPHWFPLSTSCRSPGPGDPPDSLDALGSPGSMGSSGDLDVRTAGLARLREDLENLSAVVVPELGTLGELVTGAWAWCPDGPELPRAVMVAWGLSLLPVPGLGKTVEAMMDELGSEVSPVSDDRWGAPTAGRAGAVAWSADLERPRGRPGQVVVDAPSGTVLTLWRRGWPVDVGGTITVLAPGWDPQGRLPEILRQAEVSRTRPAPRASAGSAVLDHLRREFEGRRLDAGRLDEGRLDGGRLEGLLGLAQLPADRVHPRAAGVFRLAPVVGDWWAVSPGQTGPVLPSPPARPSPVREVATAANLPASKATKATKATRSRTRGNAGAVPRSGRRKGGGRRTTGRTPPTGTRPGAGRGYGPLVPPAGPDRPRAVLPTLVAATVAAFAVALWIQRSIAAERLEPDAGVVITLFFLGLFVGPLLTIAGVVNLARRRPHVLAGRWLLGLGVAGIELFLALWLVAEQAGQRVF